MRFLAQPDALGRETGRLGFPEADETPEVSGLFHVVNSCSSDSFNDVSAFCRLSPVRLFLLWQGRGQELGELQTCGWLFQ